MVSQQTQDKAYGMFKSIANRAKQYALNLSEIELKVEDATNNEAWGPTGTQMSGQLLKHLPGTLISAATSATLVVCSGI